MKKCKNIRTKSTFTSSIIKNQNLSSRNTFFFFDKSHQGTLILSGFLRFFFQNNYKSQTILLVSQGFETILIFNKSSAKNLISL